MAQDAELLAPIAIGMRSVMEGTTGTLVIKGGDVLLPDGRIETRDVLIEDGSIACVGTDLSAGKRIDAGGAYVLPGLIDIHTHGLGLRECQHRQSRALR